MEDLPPKAGVAVRVVFQQEEFLDHRKFDGFGTLSRMNVDSSKKHIY